jgi:hypothetical protein
MTNEEWISSLYGQMNQIFVITENGEQRLGSQKEMERSWREWHFKVFFQPKDEDAKKKSKK